MKGNAKWKEELLERLRKVSNKDLYEWLLNIASGDDYDGCFTASGEWEYEQVKLEFEKRLTDWLK